LAPRPGKAKSKATQGRAKTTKSTRTKAPTKAQRLAELLEQTRFSVADLEELGGMPTVRTLDFRPGSTFARGGLVHLAKIRNLQFLRFEDSKLSTADLEACARCRGLRQLGLEGCSFPGKALSVLSGLPRLRDLWLQRTRVADRDLAGLSGIATLEWLILDETHISDRGLKHLVGLPKLQTLRLRDTRVTDAGALTLAAAPKVRFNLGCFADTKVTQAGLDAAFAARRGGKAKTTKKEAKAGTRLPAAEDAKAAGEVVKGFLKAMNGWERAAAKAWKQDRDVEELRPDRDAIFARYCTVKKRAYSEVLGFSEPPSYSPRKESIQGVEQKGPSRLEVLTQRKPAGAGRRLWVLRKKGGAWRIDSLKESTGGPFRAAVL
jgi:hypothetical protein